MFVEQVIQGLVSIAYMYACGTCDISPCVVKTVTREVIEQISIHFALYACQVPYCLCLLGSAPITIFHLSGFKQDNIPVMPNWFIKSVAVCEPVYGCVHLRDPWESAEQCRGFSPGSGFRSVAYKSIARGKETSNFIQPSTIQTTQC